MKITTDHAALTAPRKVLVLLGLLLALFLADGVITRFLIDSGMAIEGNPFLKAIVTTDSFFWLKLAGGVIACLLLWDLYQRAGKPIIVVTSVFVILFNLIIYWNVTVAIIGLANL